METINIDQSQIELTQLLLRVENGEELILAHQGIPIAKLISSSISKLKSAHIPYKLCRAGEAEL